MGRPSPARLRGRVSSFDRDGAFTSAERPGGAKRPYGVAARAGVRASLITTPTMTISAISGV